MSRASEWAIRADTPLLSMRFRPNHPSQHGLALVERNGGLYLELGHRGVTLVGASLDPAEAMALARWILDTFGEGTA